MTVIVGVDGSTPSRAALAWAIGRAVDTSELADSGVTSTKILNGTIATADIAASAVDGQSVEHG